MTNLYLFNEYFDLYNRVIKPLVSVDEYLDFINTIPVYYRSFYSLLDFESALHDHAFAWYCLENRDWFLDDFIGHSEPVSGDEV